MKPLTIDQFDVSDANILDPSGSKYGLRFSKLVSIANKQLPPIRVDGELKVFANERHRKKYYLLAIAIDESNQEFFKKLEKGLSRLASTAFCSSKPEDFKLIKESKNYRNVYFKIYMNSSDKPKRLYSELVDGKRKNKPLEDTTFEKLKGSYIVRVIHAFSVKTKGISICADEIINFEPQKSYFDEFPE